jgi:hypothetical protein
MALHDRSRANSSRSRRSRDVELAESHEAADDDGTDDRKLGNQPEPVRAVRGPVPVHRGFCHTARTSFPRWVAT